MSVVTFTASENFNIEDNVNTFNANVDQQIGSRISTELIGNCITVSFSITLDSTQNTLLHNLSSVFVDNSLSKKRFYTVIPKTNIITTEAYTFVARFTYAGTAHVGPLNYIEVVSNMDSGGLSYSIKVIDATDNNNTIVVETGLNNTSPQVNNLGQLQNVPEEAAVFEMYAKATNVARNKATNVYIDDITLYYGN